MGVDEEAPIYCVQGTEELLKIDLIDHNEPKNLFCLVRFFLKLAPKKFILTF